MRAPAALLAAAAAFAAAAIGAIGPAGHVRSEYTWPGRVPQSTRAPAGMWVTSLLLERRHAASIVVRMRCALPDPLSGAGRHRLVLSTTRQRASGGLALNLAAGRLQLRVGRVLVRRLPWSTTSADPGCRRTLDVTGRRWSLADEHGTQLAHGTLPYKPTVNGLLSSLDLRQPGLTVTLTTEVAGVSLRPMQIASDSLAVCLALVALLLAWRPRPPSRLPRPRLLRPRAVDVVVVAALLGWWVIGPAFYDDGWVRARELNYSASGGFSNYFDTWGALMPLGHWLEWLQHWVMLASAAAPVLRVFPLLAGLGLWSLCRYALSQALGAGVARPALVEWTLATGFVVSFFAWGMTLRPEPVVALLVLGSLATVLRFVRSPSIGPLVVLSLVVPLAVTAHPAGIIVLAPVLAAAIPIGSWAWGGGRIRLAGVAAIVVSAAALVVLLLFLGTDLTTWWHQVGLYRALPANDLGWRDELSRYTMLNQSGFGTPVRRLSVAFLTLSILAFVTRRSHRRDYVADVPALAIAISLGLLVFTPSKWPWHFGVLIGLGAVALAVETWRFVREGREGRWRSLLRPVGAIVAIVAVTGWAWYVNTHWVYLDLHTISWPVRLGSPASVAARLAPASIKQTVAGVVLLIVLAAGWYRLRTGRWTLGRPLWAVGAVLASILAAVMVAVTAATPVRDTQVSHGGWTLTRQNLDFLEGKTTCGLGDSLVVPEPESIHALVGLRRSGPAGPGSARGLVSGGVLPSGSRPPFGAPPVWGSAGAPAGSRLRWSSPWYAASTAARTGVGVYLTGQPTSNDHLSVVWGRSEGARVVELASRRVSLSSELPSQRWQLLAGRLFTPRPGAADAVRLVLTERAHKPGDWLGVSAPVGFRWTRLSTLARSAPGRLLVAPTLGLYLPCVTSVPKLADGVAQMPQLTLTGQGSGADWPLDDPSSPFAGVLDMRGVFELPLRGRWPTSVAVFATAPLPVGDAQLPTSRRLLDS